MAVNLTIHNPAASGTIIEQLGGGTFNHIRFAGAASGTPITSGTCQSTSWISNSAGVPAGAAGTSGALPNAKYVSSSNILIHDNAGVQAYSGTLAALGASTVATAPDFDLRPSGTLMIKLASDDSSVFRTSNTYLWCDDGTTPATAPTNVTPYAVEFHKDGEGSSSWSTIAGSGSRLVLRDHSDGNGYAQSEEHIFSVAISMLPTTSGTLEDIRFTFQTDFGA